MRPTSPDELLNYQRQLQQSIGLFNYNFATTQKDVLDRLTDAIVYKSDTYEIFSQSDAFQNLGISERDYATARWFNHMSAQGVEAAFELALGAKANKNIYDKLVDFELNGKTYDHKSSVFPAALKEHADWYLDHPAELALWMYRNQSQNSRRKAINNRIYVVCHNSNGRDHWKLKADVFEIFSLLKNYRKEILDSMFDLNVDGTIVNTNLIYYCA